MSLRFVARCMIYIAAPDDEDRITEVFSAEHLFDASLSCVNDFRNDIENALLEYDLGTHLGWFSVWIKGHYEFGYSSDDPDSGYEDCHIDEAEFTHADESDMYVLGQPYEPPPCVVYVPLRLTMESLINKSYPELRVADVQKEVGELEDEPSPEQTASIADRCGVPLLSVLIVVNMRRKYEWARQLRLQELKDKAWLAGHGEGQPVVQSLWRKFRGYFNL